MPDYRPSATIPPAWQNRSPIQRDILVVLALRPDISGSTINNALGRRTDQKQAIYKHLEKLRDHNYIQTTGNRKGSDGQANRLTEDGEELVYAAIVETARHIDL